MSRSVFTRSGQAEVIRAAQKDDLITNNLQESLSDIIFKTAGNRTWLRWRGALESSGKLLYYGLTTLSNYQTMGEEYTGIVQVDGTLRNIPSKTSHLLMILLHAYGPHLLLHLLHCWEQELQQPSVLSSVQPAARTQMLQAVVLARQLLPFIERFHSAAFFLWGRHYHVSKRAAGVHYILARHWLPKHRSSHGFRLLGCVSLLYLVSHCAHTWWQSRSLAAPAPAPTPTPSERSPSLRCSLCMEERRHTAATVCGHLFCWDCVVRWLQTSGQCPMCRETVAPHRVVLLRNYERRGGGEARRGAVGDAEM